MRARSVAAFGACVVAAVSAVANASEITRPIGMYAVTTGAPLAMLDSKLDLAVHGPIVEAVITQRFRNPTDLATEATYIFPLPIDAAVSAMQIRTGSRTLTAAIEPREAARRRYEAAIAAGVSAARLDQERPDVFTQSVAAIPPQGIVEVTLRVDTTARFRAGTWELAWPMVVAPRFVPGAASGRPTIGSGRAPDTDRAPDASHVTPDASPNAGGATRMTLRFAVAPLEVTSPTHAVEVSGDQASLVDAHSDHDAIVRWKLAARAAAWLEGQGDRAYAAVVVEAGPAAPRRGRARCIVAIDRAATTRGDGEIVEHPFVQALLSQLAADDQVEVRGGAEVAWSAPKAALAAVEQRWQVAAAPFDLTRVVQAARGDRAPLVLVSDGLVADDRAAIEAARALGSPIHVIGIGAVPARGLLTQLAAVSGGTIRFAAPADDLAALAADVISDLTVPASPMTVNWGELGVTDVEPALRPRLGANQASLVVARVHRSPVVARAGGQVIAFEVARPSRAVDGATTADGPLARRWAKLRLDDLLATARPAEVTAHAIAHGLVSPYTSMVAVGVDVVVEGGVRRTVSIPVSVPAGMDWGAVEREIRVDTGSTWVEPAPPAAPPPVSKMPVEHKPAAGDEDDEAALESANRPRVVVAADGPRAESAEYESVAVAQASTRQLRLSLGGGGGVLVDHGAAAIAAFNLRAELGQRTRVGGEASLWFVAGRPLEGRALLTIGRRFARRFEAGIGAGAQFGDGSGIASSLRLHATSQLIDHAGAYLRYDNALLFRTATESEHVLTLGLDYSF